MLEIIYLPLKKLKVGRHPIITTPQRNRLQHWLSLSLLRKRPPWKMIPRRAPELGLEHEGEKPMKKVMDTLGYCPCPCISKRRDFQII
jgi:hypothetical protein